MQLPSMCNSVKKKRTYTEIHRVGKYQPIRAQLSLQILIYS
jgi:hypothetical protein